MFTFIILFLLLRSFSHLSSVTAEICWRGTKCAGPSDAAFTGDWDKFNFSPQNRTISPIRILSKDVNFLSSYPGDAELRGNGSGLIFDFGKEVGGLVTVVYNATGTARLGLAFSEAKNWAGEWSDDSNGSFHPDGALFADVESTHNAIYGMPLNKLRGGFRYLTIFEESESNSTIHILNVTLEIAFQPDWPNLRAYKGYFSCSDDLLTEIWYSGAYTLQTNAIPPTTGREFPILGSGWLNDGDLSLEVPVSSVYVDGSKRDRTVWSGDLQIAVPSILVSTGDWIGVKGTLDILYAGQASSGELPFAGPRINIFNSDTYHMATLIGSYEYFLWTNDISWLESIYKTKFKKAMSFITNKIDTTGMLFVTGKEDWGRLSQGGHNTEANLLLYKVLVGGTQIAEWMNDITQASEWSSLADTLQKSVNRNNFDMNYGAYIDSSTDTSIYPQDANSLALLYNFYPPGNGQRISTALTRNWISIGSLAPELPNNLVGYGQSLEVKGHFKAFNAQYALDLIRRAWGWYLNNPFGTASTCIEGYRADGSFGYRAETGYGNHYSYTSHAHGWSTGPTDALTSYIVGLTITEPGGQKWAISPQFADLTYAEAGFSTPLGKFSSKWILGEGGFTLSWDAPHGTQGVLIIPITASRVPDLVLDEEIWIIDQNDLDIMKDKALLPGKPGRHTLKVMY
ncbi:putative bacterial alpha-l-rhamnosidase domain protein [Golovinomyces cichoracearum]|uniref:Putative bacterial alpha-l-rhamnosidase domain protein n=1 Tax=Golovinomyces cichoracearum TaxID=62708 RepID=A0A420ILT3_9PEZI|nr:putative bacterial alpha-l-rhamnosidase domain protein [Golovinomyces cichoracearum]